MQTDKPRLYASRPVITQVCETSESINAVHIDTYIWQTDQFLQLPKEWTTHKGLRQTTTITQNPSTWRSLSTVRHRALRVYLSRAE